MEARQTLFERLMARMGRWLGLAPARRAPPPSAGPDWAGYGRRPCLTLRVRLLQEAEDRSENRIDPAQDAESERLGHKPPEGRHAA